MDLASIPVVDQHCHSLLRAQPQDALAFRALFSESYFPEIAREHVQHTLFFHWMLRELAQFYGCAADLEAIVASRRALGLHALTRKVALGANMRAWLVDYGFITQQVYAHEELQGIVPCRVERMLR